MHFSFLEVNSGWNIFPNLELLSLSNQFLMNFLLQKAD